MFCLSAAEHRKREFLRELESQRNDGGVYGCSWVSRVILFLLYGCIPTEAAVCLETRIFMEVLLLTVKSLRI